MKYNVTDTFRSLIILRDASASQIKKHFGKTSLNLSPYLDGVLYRGRYLIEMSEDKNPENYHVPQNLYEEWGKVHKMFQNVEWVKEWSPDVRVLNR